MSAAPCSPTPRCSYNSLTLSCDERGGSTSFCRDTRQMASQLKRSLVDALRQVSDLKPKDLLQRRYDRLQSYGRFADTKDR